MFTFRYICQALVLKKKKKRMQPRADSKLFLGHRPKPLNYAFNISSLFPILQIIYDYQLLNLRMIIVKNS